MHLLTGTPSPAERRRRPRILTGTPPAPLAAAAILLALALAAFAVAAWRLAAPVGREELDESNATMMLTDAGLALRADVKRAVLPAIERTKRLAVDARVVAALRGGSTAARIEACDEAILQSTEIDAVALFDAAGRIVAINDVYADGRRIEKGRIDRIMGADFSARDVVQRCARNEANADVLEFQTTCDITPALFDSTGLSVAYSAPMLDPATGRKIGVISSRMRFERLSALVEHRRIGGVGAAEFVTDQGGYFSEEINGGRRAGPVPTAALARIVRPLVDGHVDTCLVRQGSDYLTMFRLTDFRTLAGGGVQVMLMVRADWLQREALQQRAERVAVAAGLGAMLLLSAALVRGYASLAQGERWNRMLVSSAMDAVVTVDERCIVRAWSPRAEAIFGRPARDALGRALESLVVPEAAAPGERARWTCALGGASSAGHRIEATAVRPDGTAMALEISVAPMRVWDSTWFCAFARDVTEARATEQMLAQAQKLESVGQLAAGIAHEINTPAQYAGDNVRFLRSEFQGLMRLIDRYEELLAPSAELSWPERRAAIDGLKEEIDFEFLRREVPLAVVQSLEGLDRISAIVLAMKDFSHPSSSALGEADVNRAIASTSEVCRARWKYVAELELDLDPAVPSVTCLIAELNQVFLNLIVNAADAIAECDRGEGRKGTILVSTRACRGGVEIRVSDDGPGIPEAVRGRIFEPFFTTKGIGKGTGQGLTISHAVVVKHHRGTMSFEPRPGGGTTFVVWLPIDGGPIGQIAA